MEIIKTEDFIKSFRAVPKPIRHIYDIQEKRFMENWRDPRLHIKKIKGLEHAFSFRVTRSWRVLFYFQDADEAIFFEIDHRRDVYRDL
ncbi:hypothetical protein A3B18_03705 [Candidatus Giovannonibacteria bacterium RIFCSPLOWO2_01_FULL_46_13]|uniref:Uncharacterized protein n=1 Tax=Candidatus Giovannonibacteria bacterium RIFCSPLOWO2_01_FULL_46_13 TaxID=1798352 RepID=A0A1F5X3G4_9BACT|nr:MAG: hypothetical protein A3B18_03705 [Candidatus Giovannonibacteria bacterium RIFCSPLOWO2_01_FULL_46_13]